MEVYKVRKPLPPFTDKTLEAVVPGSKSITNRALLLSAMAKGKSVLRGCMSSEDAVHFLECLKKLGFEVEESPAEGLGSDIVIQGHGGDIPNKKAEIYVGSAGTAARFLVAMLAFADGEYIVRSSDQMKKRPMQPLIDSLRKAGAEVICLEEEGHFPLKIHGVADKKEIPEIFEVNIDKSSQFLSALMIAAGTFGKKAEIRVTGSHGLSYVDLTADMMRSFGVNAEKVEKDTGISYVFSGEDTYQNLEYEIEPDMSAAAYFYAMAAVLGITTAVKGVSSHMLQGDTAFLKVLEQMGCLLKEDEKGQILVTGPSKGRLKGNLTVDMSAFSDQALTLAAIAPFADGPVSIKGIGHIRMQECDRIHAITENLEHLGIRTEEGEDYVVIHPSEGHGGEIETYEDHRVAMSFALTGLRIENVSIRNPLCCRKTFAEFFEILDRILSNLYI